MSLVPPLEEAISATLVMYTELTGENLVDDPLATKIKSCDDAIDHLFEHHAQAFGDDVKIRLHAVLDRLQYVSTTSAISEVAGLQAVCPFEYMVYITVITTLKCSVL